MYKKFVIVLLVIFTFHCCSTKEENKISVEIIKKQIIESDSLKQKYSTNFKSFISSDWLNIYSGYIKEHFPDFSIKNDSQGYFFVPTLVIPVSVLTKDNIDFTEYIEDGHLEIKNGHLFILEKGKPVGSFSITNDKTPLSFSPITFHKSFSDSNIIDVLTKSDLFFYFSVKLKRGEIYIPGIVFYSEKIFQFFNSEDNKIYPLDELYRSWSSDKGKFRSLINKLVEANRTN